MLVVGELINASRKDIAAAIEAQNEDEIKRVARDQVHAGADFVDVNAGVFVGKEADYLRWLVRTVQEEVDAPCCIDSPDPVAIENALAVHKGTAMLNSISLEKERYEALLPLVSGTDLKIVSLCYLYVIFNCYLYLLLQTAILRKSTDMRTLTMKTKNTADAVH
jgi:cobalamin-dependent methionine synthase I